MSRKWIPLICTGLFSITSGTALADGTILDGLSPRSIGRGGTNIAFADNGAVLCDNPAAMVNIQGNTMMDLGGELMLTDFDFANPRNAAAAEFSRSPLAQVALLRKDPRGNRAFGLGMFTPAGFGEIFDMEGPFPLGGQRRYKSFGALAKFLVGGAFRLTDRLSAGATLGVGVSHVELEGPYFLQSPGPFQATPMMVDIQQTGATLVWSTGLQYAWSDATTVGVTYQSESRFDMDGRTAVEIPGMGRTQYDSSLDITWPQTLGLGVRHQLCPCRTLAVDVIWTGWSNAFDDLGLHLRNPTTPGFPELDEQLPLRWRDSVSTRVGYERRFDHGQVVRLGYVHHRNPIPHGTLTPYIQAILEHAFSAGYGCVWRNWNIDLAYMYSFGPVQHVDVSDFLGGDFSQSTHRAQSHCIALSFMKQY